MGKSNAHGLTRSSLSAEVKRLVRQRSGFGCVVCGSAIYEYEHFDPEFKDAKKHEVEGITLLCPSCHSKKGRFLSRDTIRAAIAAPKALQTGFSYGAFDAGVEPSVRLGSLTAKNVRSLIHIDGEDVLGVAASESAGGPFLINAAFRDAEGKPTLSIVRNEWRTNSSSWDATVVGPEITIRRKARNFAIVLRVDAGKGIEVTRLEMTHRGVGISVKRGVETKFHFPSGLELVAQGASYEDGERLIAVTGHTLTIGQGGGRLSVDNMVIRSGLRGQRESSLVTSKTYGKVGRNELCPCGSGAKFKWCHGSKGTGSV